MGCKLRLCLPRRREVGVRTSRSRWFAALALVLIGLSSAASSRAGLALGGPMATGQSALSQPIFTPTGQVPTASETEPPALNLLSTASHQVVTPPDRQPILFEASSRTGILLGHMPIAKSDAAYRAFYARGAGEPDDQLVNQIINVLDNGSDQGTDASWLLFWQDTSKAASVSIDDSTTPHKDVPMGEAEPTAPVAIPAPSSFSGGLATLVVLAMLGLIPRTRRWLV